MAAYQTQELNKDQLGALIEVMFLAAFADGQFSEGEQTNFREVVERLGDTRLDPDAVNGLMLRAAVQLQTEGRTRRLEAARGQLTDINARRIALALAADVAGADGLAGAERKQLFEVAEALGVDHAEIKRLLEVNS